MKPLDLFPDQKTYVLHEVIRTENFDANVIYGHLYKDGNFLPCCINLNKFKGQAYLACETPILVDKINYSEYQFGYVKDRKFTPL